MTGTRYDCAEPRRRARVRERARDAAINGIDHVEVAADRRTIEVHFVSHHGLDRLGPAPFLVEGGDRVTGITVQPTAVDPAGMRVTLRASAPGDLSPYVLRLVPPDDAGGTVFDPRLSAVTFAFRADCAEPSDCAGEPLPATPAAVPPDLDHLAKDYASFRRLMLDRMAARAPGRVERNPADVVVTLVEALAAVADELSYAQDAAATEAHLGTARLRRSVCRHARLLGYSAHSGCTARAFVRLTSDVRTATLVRAPLEVTTGAVGPLAADRALPEDAVVFRTLHDVVVQERAAAIPFHTWSDGQCCLPAGATSASLADGRRDADDPPLDLAAGALLLLEEVTGPDGGPPDPARRHVVRLTAVTSVRDPVEERDVLEVAWSPEDALPFGLCVSREDGPAAVARAGIAVAECARPEQATLDPQPGPPDGRPRAYRPRLPGTGLVFRHPYDPAAPAAHQLRRDPREARPDLVVAVDGVPWRPPPGTDLLRSGPADRHVVCEVERDGVVWLRFGDGVHGARPPDLRAEVVADLARGNGTGGNVGRDTLTGFRPASGGAAALSAVTNPLPAAGGTGPEPLERIRVDAPQAFRVQRRAVTAADYATVLEQHDAVQRARARLRWTGSWHTVFAAVDLLGGRDLDAATETRLRRHLERHRMAGTDVELTGPVHVGVDLALRLCVAPGTERARVLSAARDVLSSGLRRDGRPGLLHPDRFTFGQPLYLSEVVAAVAGLAGVTSVRVTRFQRLGAPAAGELEAEVLRVAPQEVLRLAGDPDAPERGRLHVDVGGGR